MPRRFKNQEFFICEWGDVLIKLYVSIVGRENHESQNTVRYFGGFAVCWCGRNA
jgi:hypothetical protein